MKKFLVCLLLLPLAALANPIDRATATRVAENFWWLQFKEQASFTDYSDNFGLTRIYLLGENNSNGFIIVSADNRAFPVLGYSHDGFQTQKVCPSFVSWLQSYEHSIAYACDKNIPPDQTIIDEWDALTNGQPLPKAKDAIQVAPLLTSTWDQDLPYNLYCPGEGADKAPTGCVATAMAQVMYYWRFPEHGYGQNQYNYADFTDTNFNWQYGTLSADFENTHYDWDNMVNQLGNNSDSANIKAVALLNYHCGIALNMLYKPGGSMAFVTVTDNILFDTNYYPTRIAAENIIPRFFGYSPETVGKQRMNYERFLDWVYLLRDELQKNRPIIFAGAAGEGASAGHCFILDGVNPYLFFHINFGWGGLYDGDFRVDAISSRSFNFNCRQQAIIGMRPPDMFSVKVTCNGSSGGSVSHNSDNVCGTFVNMTTGADDSKLNIVAADGFYIRTVTLGSDTIVDHGLVLDDSHLSHSATGILESAECLLSDFSSDTELIVTFADKSLSINDMPPVTHFIATTNGHNIIIHGHNIQQGGVYDIMGRTVCEFDGHSADSVTIPLHHNGIFIVRCGGQSTKVVINTH